MSQLAVDLAWLSDFLKKYQDVDVPVFRDLDPMTALNDAMNRMTTLVEGRTDLAEPMQNLLLALGMSV